MADGGILTTAELASVRREYRGASLLPARTYHDPAIFDWERANILRRDWVMVGREEDVAEPGTYMLVELDGVDPAKLDRLLYVGTSRARQHLVVIASPAVLGRLR